MGLFDRMFPKKDAPESASFDPDAPPTTGQSQPAPTPMDDASRAISDAGKTLSDKASALVEAAKPLGQNFVAEVSSASRDLGGVLRDLSNPPMTSSNPDSAPVSDTGTPVSTAAASDLSQAEVAQAVEAAPPPTSDLKMKDDDALPLPDSFDPFCAPLESAPTMTPDAATGETRAHEMLLTATTVPLVAPVATVPVVPVAVEPAQAAPTEVPPAALDAEGNLEEYQEPLPQVAPSLLEAGTRLSLQSGDGNLVEVVVEQALAPRGEVNCYRAQSGTGASLLLREAAQSSADAARLEREQAARRAINSPQIPLPAAFGTHGERVYLADLAGDSASTFASQLSENTPIADQIFTLTQAAAALSQLHKSGFVHGAVRPEAILLGKPVKLSGLESLSPLGQKAAQAASFAGYGAPEILAGAPLDARTDIYSVGALLHRILTGSGVPETGWDETTFAPQLVLPGAPQIIAKTLGPPATRYSDMASLHRDLVRLRGRLKPLARHEACGETTIGLEWGRTTNQDAWGELRGQKQGEDGAVAWTAWVVSDGMGGMASGEVASQVAVSAVLKDAATWGADFDGKMPLESDQAQLVKTWTRDANREAVDAMEKIGARGGCTLVCGLVIDRRLTLAHVGDCRAYLLRGGELTQLTRDHSYVMSLVMQGEITRDQMRSHPDRSKITRSLGDRHIMPDYFVDGLEVEMKVPSMELRDGDVLLAFSDGVWEPVLESEMQTIMASSSSLEEAANRLVEAAMREGGPDNATAYLFKMNESTPVVVDAVVASSGDSVASANLASPLNNPIT